MVSSDAKKTDICSRCADMLSELLGKDGLQGVNSAAVDRTQSAAALVMLQKYLEKHDHPENNYKHRLEVVARILQRNPDFDLQPWLTQHYLVRILSIFDLGCLSRCNASIISVSLTFAGYHVDP